MGIFIFQNLLNYTLKMCIVPHTFLTTKFLTMGAKYTKRVQQKNIPLKPMISQKKLVALKETLLKYI